MQPVFRFAPSPNGYLHLGHAYSALLNERRARESGGRFLLRIEDIDTIRCKPELVEACFEDLRWLGLTWEEPVLRQSSQFGRYCATVEGLRSRALVYPCFCSRRDILKAIEGLAGAGGDDWPRDPDGSPLYPGTCRALDPGRARARIDGGSPFAFRLDMRAASREAGRMDWEERDRGRVAALPEKWGDFVISRKETPTSYHLAVVLDDALQGITHVVRGMDLFHATAIHRLLQTILGLPEPAYEHHRLIEDAGGLKLSKSRGSPSLRELRAGGAAPGEIHKRLGFSNN